MTLAIDTSTCSSHRDGQTVGAPCFSPKAAFTPLESLPNQALLQSLLSCLYFKDAQGCRFRTGSPCPALPALWNSPVCQYRVDLFSALCSPPFMVHPLHRCSSAGKSQSPLTSYHSLASLPPASPDALSFPFPFTKGLLLTSHIFPVSLIRQEPN